MSAARAVPRIHAGRCTAAQWCQLTALRLSVEQGDPADPDDHDPGHDCVCIEARVYCAPGPFPDDLLGLPDAVHAAALAERRRLLDLLARHAWPHVVRIMLTHDCHYQPEHQRCGVAVSELGAETALFVKVPREHVRKLGDLIRGWLADDAAGVNR